VIDESDLPTPLEGMEWRPVDSFDANDELSKHPGLKEVFKVAIDEGCAVISAPALRPALSAASLRVSNPTSALD
jgi:hypothetical protein